MYHLVFISGVRHGSGEIIGNRLQQDAVVVPVQRRLEDNLSVNARAHGMPIDNIIIYTSGEYK